jgi:3',5'-cyclic AMP phosphodiesterase CpdA
MKFLTAIFLLIFIVPKSFAQTNSSYSILVAGHAYGAHSGTNIGLHPPLLTKLREIEDPKTMGIFLTGDIVNNSTSESWKQVENELSGMSFNSYYVMGNHDDNSIGHAEFQKKHGGAYYHFNYQNDLYVVLNSTESDRSISATQLQFLDNALANTEPDWERAFIFFHEVIWNSNEKYRLLRSNSRSRYAQMVLVSNFWQEVYPRFAALPEKQFYLFAGDVGGNPDAIAASYDRWENVTLLSSGMGEVSDENYLKVNVLPDTVTFELIPLNHNQILNQITWYNVPEKPMEIIGSETVNPLQKSYNYQASPVFNVTSYRWSLSSGISGISDSSQIALSFNPDFQTGEISVTAINDGFGESEPLEMSIKSTGYTSVAKNMESKFRIFQDQQDLQIVFYPIQKSEVRIRIYNTLGQLLLQEQFSSQSGISTTTMKKNNSLNGPVLVELLLGNERFTQKIMLR